MSGTKFIFFSLKIYSFLYKFSNKLENLFGFSLVKEGVISELNKDVCIFSISEIYNSSGYKPLEIIISIRGINTPYPSNYARVAKYGMISAFQQNQIKEIYNTGHQFATSESDDTTITFNDFQMAFYANIKKNEMAYKIYAQMLD